MDVFPTAPSPTTTSLSGKGSMRCDISYNFLIVELPMIISRVVIAIAEFRNKMKNYLSNTKLMT
jgi:hypothetical protein